MSKYSSHCQRDHNKQNCIFFILDFYASSDISTSTPENKVVTFYCEVHSNPRAKILPSTYTRGIPDQNNPPAKTTFHGCEPVSSTLDTHYFLYSDQYIKLLSFAITSTYIARFQVKAPEIHLTLNNCNYKWNNVFWSRVPKWFFAELFKFHILSSPLPDKTMANCHLRQI